MSAIDELRRELESRGIECAWTASNLWFEADGVEYTILQRIDGRLVASLSKPMRVEELVETILGGQE